MNNTYELFRARSTAAEFHAREVAEPVRPEIWLHEITNAALVLGSAQPREDVDEEACERGGVDVVRRRSGGGAVLLIPGDVTWIDVILPTGATGWSADIHQPMVWLGRCLSAVLADLLAGTADHRKVAAHDGSLVSSAWSRVVCFDGVGSGEVILDGKKLIGMSQRRTRNFARFQCCWYSRYDPNALVALLNPKARLSVGELQPVATVTPDVAAQIPYALLAYLNGTGQDPS